LLCDAGLHLEAALIVLGADKILIYKENIFLSSRINRVYDIIESIPSSNSQHNPGQYRGKPKCAWTNSPANSSQL
jgi:hypothetical protein